MIKPNFNSKVDSVLGRAKKWQEEMETLRNVVLSCGLVEELKWGQPCYVLDKANIVLIHSFKEYCALLFFKGALMKDSKNILIQQTKNVQAARQVRFISITEIIKLKPILKEYIIEAIEIEKAGLKVELKKTKEFDMPAEFKNKLESDSKLEKAFKELTPGRQRGYLLYFSTAKLIKTRITRIEKSVPHIFSGKGWNE